MTYEERTKLEGELMTRGIFLSDFISSSTYDAVVKILHESKQASTNTLLAVSGLTAIDFLRGEVKKYEPFTPNGLNQLPYALYDAVAQAMENYQAACASGAVDKTVSEECLKCGTKNNS